MSSIQDPQTESYFAPLRGATYIQLTTFRRSGTGVPTAVHVVLDGDEAFFRTWNTTGKAKRLRHTPDVRVAPSNIRGRPRGPAFPARAYLLDGEASDRAARLLASRHPILHGRLIPWYHRRRGWTTQQYRLVPPSGG
ncbi:MAG TPA: PPOX class F420-dependent oxidoreductase [Streptosporangiaceae bacterium]|nr:PPOX class F420-dependent oxidoreductase [Streptosporangiaceae bacterium]